MHIQRDRNDKKKFDHSPELAAERRYISIGLIIKLRARGWIEAETRFEYDNIDDGEMYAELGK